MNTTSDYDGMKVLAVAYIPDHDEPLRLVETEHNGVRSRYVCDTRKPTPADTNGWSKTDYLVATFLMDSWRDGSGSDQTNRVAEPSRALAPQLPRRSTFRFPTLRNRKA